MLKEHFFKVVERYTVLTPQARDDWGNLLHQKTYLKDQYFVRIGEIPHSVGFVANGLFSCYQVADDGDPVIKKFFPEQSFVASTSAMLQAVPSTFYVKALEDSLVYEYDFPSFRILTARHHSIAAFYIAYMERHWIIEKEPLEVAFRSQSAADRYRNFLQEFPGLEPRLKQHHVASYLGVTPTQLSRIRKALEV